MPLPLTHALVPVAAVVAIGRHPFPGKIIAAAVGAAMAPDLDIIMHPLFGVAIDSIYSHRGFSHSLFTALLFGGVAAACHRQLKVPPLVAGVVIAAAMASHGVLDMMTDSGRPVGYGWPLTSLRMFADWRPFPGKSVQFSSTLAEVLGRTGPEMRRIVAPLFAVALFIRVSVWAWGKVARR